MQKNKNIIAVLTENRIQLLITLVSVVIAIVNFLIVNKLQPLAQDLNSVVKRVEAIEENYVDNELFNEMCGRLDRIDAKLENLIRLHLSN